MRFHCTSQHGASLSKIISYMGSGNACCDMLRRPPAHLRCVPHKRQSQLRCAAVVVLSQNGTQLGSTQVLRPHILPRCGRQIGSVTQTPKAVPRESRAKLGLTRPRKTVPQEVGNFGLGSSVSAGFTGIFRNNVTQVMVSSNRLED